MVYTIWDDAGVLIYVGVSGRNPGSKTGPWGRLRAHRRGRRSGDQFSIYVADHYVLPELSGEQVEAIAADDPSLFVDDLVARVVRERFSFRVAVVSDYRSALRVEAAVKAGGLSAGRPRLNPRCSLYVVATDDLGRGEAYTEGRHIGRTAQRRRGKRP